MRTETGGPQKDGTTSPETLRRSRRGGRGVGRARLPAHELNQTPTVPEPAMGKGTAEVEAPACMPGRTSTHGQTLPPIPSEEWQRIEHAYREIQRRDGSAEQRAWRWERFALVLIGLVTLLLGVVVWQLLDARKVQAVVQVVQLDEKGQLSRSVFPTIS